ncbi:hypothetical protein PAMP_015950 [Pampus punctatissimus]
MAKERIERGGGGGTRSFHKAPEKVEEKFPSLETPDCCALRRCVKEEGIMPFCKRTVLPKDVCKPDCRSLLEAARPQQAEIFGDLVDVCGFTLCSVLRQLSDLSRHSVSILEELEGELVSVCHRSGALEGRMIRLQRHVAELVSKPPPRIEAGLMLVGGGGFVFKGSIRRELEEIKSQSVMSQQVFSLGHLRRCTCCDITDGGVS